MQSEFKVKKLVAWGTRRNISPVHILHPFVEEWQCLFTFPFPYNLERNRFQRERLKRKKRGREKETQKGEQTAEKTT